MLLMGYEDNKFNSISNFFVSKPYSVTGGMLNISFKSNRWYVLHIYPFFCTIKSCVFFKQENCYYFLPWVWCTGVVWNTPGCAQLFELYFECQ